MNCAACGQGLPAGSNQRCPFCAALLAPPAEGALAPNLVPFASPLPGSQEPLREIPGLRKRERTWKDEVKDRVSDRRRNRSAEGDELPLFPGSEEAPQAPSIQSTAAERAGSVEAEPSVHGAADRSGASPRLRELDDEVARLMEPRELLLRPREREEAVVEPEVRAQPAASPRTLVDLEDEAEEDEWSLGGAPESGEAAPVERPAGAGERLLAAALDALFWGSLSAIVVYFASRIARVAPWGLRPTWPYLVGYLAALGLGYAVYFTGTTGQTLGKMATRLRVVDSQGRPPVYGRALLRTLAGSLGIALAALGVLPMLFDPARRTVHDRLTRTRVVKSA